MEELLMTHFITHYGLIVPELEGFIIQTNEKYFEIEDTNTRELKIHSIKNKGMAKFSNQNEILCTIANYDKFLTALPNSFQRGKGRCDLFMMCNSYRYFILGELKDSLEIKSYRKKAKKQLLSSLETLLEVPQIRSSSKTKDIKRCCYFNKQSKSPETLNVVEAFNRLNNIDREGLKMENKEIEAYGWEFWEYTGSQVFDLTL